MSLIIAEISGALILLSMAGFGLYCVYQAVYGDDAADVPEPRKRYLKVTCEGCGKLIARTASGKMWKHDCRPGKAAAS